MKKGRDFDVRGVTVFQKSEITEHQIYKNLAGRVRGLKSRRILSQIADDEMRQARLAEQVAHLRIERGKIERDQNIGLTILDLVLQHSVTIRTL